MKYQDNYEFDAYVCDYCKGDSGEFNPETGNHVLCEKTTELQSTITQQADLIRRLREDAEFWLQYYLDDIDIDKVAEQLSKHTALVKESEGKND